MAQTAPYLEGSTTILDHPHGPPYALGPLLRGEYSKCAICQCHILLGDRPIVPQIPKPVPFENRVTGKYLNALVQRQSRPSNPRNHPFIGPKLSKRQRYKRNCKARNAPKPAAPIPTYTGASPLLWD